MKTWSVYVGRYKNTADSKKDNKNLLDIGYKGYLFSCGEYFSLKVFTSATEDKAKYTKLFLEKKGFDAYLG